MTRSDMTTTLGPDVVEHVIGRTGELSLRLPAGSVVLRGTDGETVRVRDLDGESLEDRFQIDRGSNRLALRLPDGILIDFGGLLRGGLRRSSMRLEVELPRGANVDVDCASADIAASRLQGEQRYRSASGSIRLTGISGTVNAESVSGEVLIEGDGELRLAGRSVSGDIALRGGRLPSLALASTSGDIEIDAVLDGQGPYGIQTVSGDVQVQAHGGVRVEGKTVTGQIAGRAEHRAESRRGQHHVIVGDGRALLTFKSISGDLRIADPTSPSGVAAPVSPPAAPEPPAPPQPPQAPAAPDAHETERLAILRDLETGTIDVAEAGKRLAAIEDESND
jgi:putative adhesin